MCGIVGYVGPRDAVPLVIEALKRLEYRGYDSAGVAVVSGHELSIEKVAGKIAVLEAHLGTRWPRGPVAIGHTRWATHGVPNTVNAHPHTDCGGIIALVHNGIIENGSQLRDVLTRRGHTFRSETDTEVLAHLIEEAYTGTLEAAVSSALKQVVGTYGIAVVSTREPLKLVAARNGSPLLVGLDSNENFVASDAAAVLQHTRSVMYLDDGEIAVVTPEGYSITDLDTKDVAKRITPVDWDQGTVERGGYPHFMLKEIMEQPESLRNAMRGRLAGRRRHRPAGRAQHALTKNCCEIDRIVIYRLRNLVACGVDRRVHAGRVRPHSHRGRIRLASSAIATRSSTAAPSWWASRNSGETADTLAALREAKRRGPGPSGSERGRQHHRPRSRRRHLHSCRTGNRRGQHQGIHLPDRVAGTADPAPGRLHALSVLQGREVVRALRRLPEQVARSTEQGDEVEQIAKTYDGAHNVLYLGRGVQFPGRPGRRAQVEGDLLHPCRGLSGSGNEAWSHRADRRLHAGGVHRPARRGIPENRVEHPGSESAAWASNRGGDPGRHSDRRAGRPHHQHSRNHRPPDPGLERHSTSVAGVLHRGAAGVQRGSTQKSCEVRYGRMTGGRTGRRAVIALLYCPSPFLPVWPPARLGLGCRVRVVVQRVSRASVTIDGKVAGSIGAGFLVLVGFVATDTAEQIDWMADKIAGLRVFADAEGKMNRDLAEAGGAVLVVSQFTLYGDVRKGRRPSFIDAARPEVAIPLYQSFIAALRSKNLTVATGEFGAEMQVDLVNDGPVTLVIER